MPTLIYNPGVRIIISTRAGNVYDVSDDIEAGSLILNENSPHSLHFVLSNANSKYSQLFTPNDRVIVLLKRLNWMQLMSGYLDTVPYYSAYPRSVNFSATCTLKRFKYFGWDAASSNVVNLLIGLTTTSNIAAPTDTIPGVIIGVLSQVVGWDVSKIHFGALPQGWLDKIAPLWSAVEADQATALAALAPRGGASGGTGGAGGGYGGTSGLPGANETLTFQQIMEVWISNGGPVAIAPLMAAIATAETGGMTGTGSNVMQQGQPYATTGWGLWQITPGDSESQVGKDAQLLDPNINAKAALAKYTDAGNSVRPWQSDRAWAKWQAHGAPANPTVAQIQSYGIETLGATEPTLTTTTTGSGAAGTNNYHDNTTQGTGSGTTTSSTAASGGTLPPQAPGAAAVVAYALAQVGKPYVWAGKGPDEFDCSGLVYASWMHATPPTNIAGSSMSMYTNPTIWPVDISQLEAGDLLFSHTDNQSATLPTHVAMYAGNDTVVEAAATPISTSNLQTWLNAYIPGNSTDYFMGAGRVTNNGGSPGFPGGAVNLTAAQVAAAGTGGSSLGTGTSSGGTGLGGALAYGLGKWDPTGAAIDTTAADYIGLKALEQDQPIMPMITSLMQVAMRSYCSAPNGDLIAWWPDYFGQYGTLAAWHLSMIELIDFQMNWSDAQLLTHIYVAGQVETLNQTLDPTGNTIPLSLIDQLESYGTATIDIPQILYTLFNIDPNGNSVYANPNSIYRQFGARVHFEYMPTVAFGAAEFWFALQLFITNWAKQFSATIELTFMPELFPGMLLALDDIGIQVYINSVTHNWSLSENGSGFTTTVNVQSPSAIAKDGSGIGLGLVGLAKGDPVNAS